MPHFFAVSEEIEPPDPLQRISDMFQFWFQSYNLPICTLWNVVFSGVILCGRDFLPIFVRLITHYICSTMLDERLFYFIHGMVTMYFLVAGLHRVNRENASRLEHFSGYVLLYWFFLEAKDLVFYLAPVFRDNYISNLLILIDMTAVTAGCSFVIELLNPGWFTLRRAFVLVSPFLLSISAYALTEAEWIMHATFIFVVCYSIGFTIYMVYAVRRYNRMLRENFSNIEYVHVRWLKGVAVMLAVCLVVWIISCYYSSWVVDSCYQVLLLLLWVVTLYFADRQHTPQIALASGVSVKPDGDNLIMTLLERNLEQLMREKKVWMEPHLTLPDLAALVGTNRTYLSNYLNNTLHTTFYDYINGFRLEAALALLNDPDSSLTMVELAESCGFNSTSTFRRVFVRAMGCSYVDYRNSILAEKQPQEGI